MSPNVVNPIPALDPFNGAQIRFGVMGSSAEPIEERMHQLCRELGAAIAGSGCCVVTGACRGYPHEVVLGAILAGGRAFGISPATNLKEHIARFDSPYLEYEMIYTGLGLMGRELINIRSSDVVIIIGGRSGTLGEFAIAYDEGKLIGVLDHTGGIADAIPDIERRIGKDTGAEVLRAANAKDLVQKMLDRYLSVDYVCPSKPVA